MEASLHTQWDLYGTFCFVPAEDDAIAMLAALRESNKIWKQTSYLSNPERPLDVRCTVCHQMSTNWLFIDINASF